MDWFKEKGIYIPIVYLNFLLIFVIINIAYKIQGFNYWYLSGIFLAGVFIYWLYSFVLRKARYRILLTLVIIVGLAVAYRYNKDAAHYIFTNWIYQNSKDISKLVFTLKDTYFFQFKTILTITIPILVPIILYIIRKRFGNIILLFTFAYMVLLWYTGFTEEVKKVLEYYIFVAMITYSFNIYIKKVMQMNKNGVKLSLKFTRTILYTIAVCFLITISIRFMPQTFTGKTSGNFISKLQNKFAKDTKDAFSEKGAKLGYNLSESGYNSDSKLGGPIILNDATAFKVKADKPYYLKGVVKDFYDGFLWKTTGINYEAITKKEDNLFTDTFSKNLMDKENELTIIPDELVTSTFFTPSYAFNITNQDGTNVFKSQIPTFLNEDAIKKSYSIKFYDPKAELGVFSEDWESKSKSTNEYYVNAFFNADKRAIAYDKKLFTKYLQIPDNISPEIINKVHEITKNCKNDFEKVAKIKDYLQQNYTYSLNVEDIPQGEEFLGHFLLKEKKGYCTYFATAATIMCRIAGIPARYVEGFNMHDNKGLDGLYTVSNRNAHAWTEVLFYPSSKAGLWSIVDCVPNASELIRQHYDQIAREISSQTSGSSTSTPKPSRIKDFNPEEAGGNALKTINGRKLALNVLLILILLSIIGRFTYFFIRRHRIIKAASVLPVYKYSLRRLKKAHLKMPENMTELEYFGSLKEKELRSVMEEILKLAYAEYYGNKENLEFDKKAYYKFIEKYMRSRQNIFRYSLNKFFF